MMVCFLSDLWHELKSFLVQSFAQKIVDKFKYVFL